MLVNEWPCEEAVMSLMGRERSGHPHQPSAGERGREREVRKSNRETERESRKEREEEREKNRTIEREVVCYPVFDGTVNQS